MQTSRTLPYRPHNHEHCIADALSDARAICQQRNARLTRIREQILKLIWQSHQPLGAYDVLEMMQDLGHRCAPPTVYRALDFLQKHGLVHRIASQNAFIGCSHAGHRHEGVFFICQHCGNVLEIAADPVAHALDVVAEDVGFQVKHAMLEVSGICPTCAQTNSGVTGNA